MTFLFNLTKENMLNIFTRAPKFTLQTLADGRTAIVNTKTGDVVNTYARTRDAKRGADRAGLQLV